MSSLFFIFLRVQLIKKKKRVQLMPIYKADSQLHDAD